MSLKKSAFIIVALSLFANVFAEQALTMKIGPVWPQDLLDNEKSTAWSASFQNGYIVDRKICFGAGVDFMWNVLSKERESSENALLIEDKKRMLSFPLFGFVTLTPFPDLLIYPAITGQVGFNTVYFSHDSSDLEGNLQTENEWYIGVTGKVAADAMYNMGEDAAILIGVEYQWSKPSRVPKDDNEKGLVIKDMRGVGIRAGFRAIF